MTGPRTLLDKIWEAHVVANLGDGWSLIHVDRHVLHDLSGPPALMDLRKRDLPVRNPELTFATPDHTVSSRPGRVDDTFPAGARLVAGLRALTAAAGVRLFDLGSEGQGIVHIIAPEMGITLPGATQICRDSHTCTNGGLGALAFGVGTTESAHALATQTLRLRKPKNMRIRIEGALSAGVTAKDLALHLLRTLGTTAGVEHNIEFAGSTVRALEVEERLTLCNLAVEMGGRSALIAPDDVVFAYLRGRRFAPAGAAFDAAVAYWRTLGSDEDAVFDRDIAIDTAGVVPTISWGTSPDQSMPIDGLVPGPEDTRLGASEDLAAALEYMGLTAGEPIAGQPVDWVFIGSCANSRISDLRAAARVVEGRSVAPGVQAWVVPGSMAVQREAEAEGLDRLFTDAGFQWREPGCSMCVAANGEQVPPGARSVSTSNRNFVGRQGPHARTHLASPAMAAAAAVTGRITDVRTL